MVPGAPASSQVLARRRQAGHRDMDEAALLAVTRGKGHSPGMR